MFLDFKEKGSLFSWVDMESMILRLLVCGGQRAKGGEGS